MNEQLLKLVDDKLAHRKDNKTISIPKFGKFPVADLEQLMLCLHTGAKLNFAPPELVKLLAAIRGGE